MGVFANLGVSVGVQDTLPKGRGDLAPITDEIASWSHVSAATGGYLTANTTIIHSRDYIDEWLENGLGRWITLRDESGNTCWRGGVDQVNANIGGVTVQRGPLMQITNRAHMVYSTVDTSTTPPTMGVRATTAQTNDTISQALFGIWQRVLSCGGTTAASAAQLQAVYLAENAQPQTSKTVTPSGGNLSMTLQLKGAWWWLAAYIANFTTTGTLNLSTRITDILGLSPNAVFSADYSQITTNAYQVKAWQQDDKNALKYMSELITFGDAAYNRYTMGFYGQEILHYKPMPSIIEYVYSMSDPAQDITRPSGTVVRPWEVLPAQWLTISDFMLGRIPDTDLRDDPRNVFIEQLNYSAPYGLTINGAKVGTLAQMLAQKGIGGLGG